MSKQVYISADYDPYRGDREVVETLKAWGSDKLHKVDFIDMSEVASGSVSKDKDCRICDLKAEFNRQINASSAVIFVVGDMTASRTAGSSCPRSTKSYWESYCTPYKENANGSKRCKHPSAAPANDGDVWYINTYSYLRHEFEQARKKRKKIIIVYNSLYKQPSWLPSYMEDYKDDARPFWTRNAKGEKVGDYSYIKQVLGYE